MTSKMNPAYRFAILVEDREVARATLQVVSNDLHQGSYGLLEDVHVDVNHRGQGYARKLLAIVIEQCQCLNLYKLVATSRNDGTRDDVHAWYERQGLLPYGKAFRKDF